MPDKNKQFKDANSKKDFDKMLKSVKVLHDLEKLCSENPLKCEDLDKKILCDSTLILLGYPNIIGFDTCKIYKELYKLMKAFDLNLNGYNIKKVPVSSFEYDKLSRNFVNFITVNGYTFQENNKLFRTKEIESFPTALIHGANLSRARQVAKKSKN
jgi:hypothetical protein